MRGETRRGKTLAPSPRHYRGSRTFVNFSLEGATEDKVREFVRRVAKDFWTHDLMESIKAITLDKKYR